MWQSGKGISVNLGPREIQMAMVLGAGASAHLGYPLGPKLADNIIENTRNPEGPSFQQLLEMGFPEDLITTFGDAFARSLPPSIDEFLSHRREFVDIGRACIAQELIKYEDETVLRIRNNNWYACWLRDKACDAIENNAEGPTVITFNYDRSLDKFLYDVVSSTYPGRVESLPNVIPIFHVHGRLGYLPHEAGAGFKRLYSKQASSKDIRDASEGIRVPIELDDDYGREMLFAQQAIKRAKQGVFLGFGYDSTNLDRLRVTEPWGAGGWTGTNKFFGTAYHLSASRREQLLKDSGGRLSLGDADTQIPGHLLSLE